MACGLDRVPDRRTFDGRFDATSLDLGSRIDSMDRLSVRKEAIDPYIVSVDSTLPRAKGNVWHKSVTEGDDGHLPRDRHGRELGHSG
jgi:hypothetical protein